LVYRTTEGVPIYAAKEPPREQAAAFTQMTIPSAGAIRSTLAITRAGPWVPGLWAKAALRQRV